MGLFSSTQTEVSNTQTEVSNIAGQTLLLLWHSGFPATLDALILNCGCVLACADEGGPSKEGALLEGLFCHRQTLLLFLELWDAVGDKADAEQAALSQVGTYARTVLGA